MPDSPTLLAIPNPASHDSELFRLLEPVDADRAALLAKLLDGTYDKPFIVEDHDSRSLYFARAYVQSRMLLDAPLTLAMGYTRTMMGFLLFHTNPRAVLMLGLGGGSLAKYCHHHLPQARIVVVEQSRDVLGFRDAFGVPRDDARFQVVEAEAGAFVHACRDQYDIVLMDAFDRQGLAPALSGCAFYEEVRTNLFPGGVLVANIAGLQDERAGYIATMTNVFGHQVFILPVEEDDNDIVFAFEDPTFEPRWRWIESQAAAMERRYGLEFLALARMLKRRRWSP